LKPDSLIAAISSFHFLFQAGVDGKSTVLRDETGKTIPLQVGADRATFVLSDLKAGKAKRYQIERSSTVTDIRVRVAADERLLRVSSGNERIFDFQLKPELPEPSIKDAFKRAGCMLQDVKYPPGDMQ